MKISAMILVGEYEPYLEYCKESIKDIVDEIIYIRDRGETDFAGWRNKALKKATGDWILYIDADEVLAKPDGKPVHRKELEMLIKTADENNINGFNPFTYHFLYNYRMIDGRNNGQHFSTCRFFRKRDVTRYEGKIHELPKFKSMPILRNLVGIVIYHFGHCKGMEEIRKKYRMSMKVEGNPYKEQFKDMTPDQYCSTHELFRMTRPIIHYNGSLPRVMKLW